MTFNSARTIGVILSILLISLSTDPTWQTNSSEESQQEPLSYLSLPSNHVRIGSSNKPLHQAKPVIATAFPG